jgi:hypothetical protein
VIEVRAGRRQHDFRERVERAAGGDDFMIDDAVKRPIVADLDDLKIRPYKNPFEVTVD